MMSGNEKLMRNNVAFVAVMSVVLNTVFVSIYGPFGAAIATAVCLASQNLIAAYMVSSCLGINTISWR